MNGKTITWSYSNEIISNKSIIKHLNKEFNIWHRANRDITFPHENLTSTEEDYEFSTKKFFCRIWAETQNYHFGLLIFA